MPAAAQQLVARSTHHAFRRATLRAPSRPPGATAGPGAARARRTHVPLQAARPRSTSPRSVTPASFAMPTSKSELLAGITRRHRDEQRRTGRRLRRGKHVRPDAHARGLPASRRRGPTRAAARARVHARTGSAQCSGADALPLRGLAADDDPTCRRVLRLPGFRRPTSAGSLDVLNALPAASQHR